MCNRPSSGDIRRKSGRVSCPPRPQSLPNVGLAHQARRSTREARRARRRADSVDSGVRLPDIGAVSSAASEHHADAVDVDSMMSDMQHALDNATSAEELTSLIQAIDQMGVA